MANISIASMAICACLILFLLIELVTFIRSINKKNGRKVFIHLMGVMSTALVSYSVIKIILGAEISSSKLVMVTTGISIIFFIFSGFDSLFVVKNKKI